MQIGKCYKTKERMYWFDEADINSSKGKEWMDNFSFVLLSLEEVSEAYSNARILVNGKIKYITYKHRNLELFEEIL